MDAVNEHEMEQFQSGKKRIAVISKAAGTGISLHADLSKNNQQPRYQIALELSWSADDQLQSFGRTHRTNQKQPPEYVILSTNAGGEKRFSSTIARRLESLGALTKGQRDASGGASVLAKYNFETEQGKQATDAFYKYLLHDNPTIPGNDLDGHDVLRQMGILKQQTDADGNPTGPATVDNADQTNVTRLLNRILNVRISAQNAVYEIFTGLFDSAVQNAIEAGTLDTGVNLVRGDSIRLAESRPIAKDPSTGAETYHYVVEVERKNKPVPASFVKDLANKDRGHMYKRVEFKGAKEPDQLMWVIPSTTPITNRNGSVETAVNTFGPGHREGTDYQRMGKSDLEEYWEPVEGTKNLRDIAYQIKELKSLKKHYEDSKASDDEWGIKYYGEREREFEASLKKLRQEVDAAKKGQFDLWQEAHDAAPLGRTEHIHLIGGSVMRVWSHLNVGSGRMDIRIAYPDTGGSVTGVVMTEGDANRVERSLTGATIERSSNSVFDAAINGKESFNLAGNIRLTQGRVNREPVIDVVSRDTNILHFLDSIGVQKERIGWNWKYYIPNDAAVGVPVLEKLLKQYPVAEEAPPRRSPESGYITAEALTFPIEAAGRFVKGAFDTSALKSAGGMAEFSRLARGGLRNAIEALRSVDTEASAVQFGEKIRTLPTGVRDSIIAEANQLRDTIRKDLPNHVDREALTLMRDFRSRPGEMEDFLNGSHKFLEDLNLDPAEKQHVMGVLEQLRPVVERALNPTPEILKADRALTNFFTTRLDQGKKLGFLDSTIPNDEYITHIYHPPDEDIKKAEGGRIFRGKMGPKRLQFARERKLPTVLHAISLGIRPRTLDAADALSVYGAKYGTTAAYWIFRRAVSKSGVGKFGTYPQQKAGKIPKDWVELAPHARLFRSDVAFSDAEGNPQIAHQMLFVPPEIEEAMRPILDPNYMNRLAGFQKSRLYGAYIKAVQLGLSIFHLRALNITALGNENLDGLTRSYMADLTSPAFQQAERSWIRAGLTTSITGHTVEAYKAMNATSLPTVGDKFRSLPVLKQVDSIAGKISHLTFGIVQRKFKVMDASSKLAAWIASHPKATPQETFEAQRQIAKEVNATYGGLHWENLGWNPMAVEISKLLMLAPDWTYSNVLNAKYAFEGGPAG